MSIETLKQEFNVTTRYIHFPLHPDTPDEGISIEKLFANRDPADLKAAQDHIRGLMREAGLEQVQVQNLSGGIAAIHSARRI